MLGHVCAFTSNGRPPEGGSAQKSTSLDALFTMAMHALTADLKVQMIRVHAEQNMHSDVSNTLESKMLM